jgi:hypothetical protein
MKTNDIKQGFYLAGQLNNDSQKLQDFLEIRRLNARATAEWTRYNNAGNPAGYEASEAKQDTAWSKAEAIAAAAGWKLTAPGLCWVITDKSGQEIGRGI